MCGCYRFHFGVDFPFLKTGSLWTQAALPPTQSDAKRCGTGDGVTWHPPSDETPARPPRHRESRHNRAEHAATHPVPTDGGTRCDWTHSRRSRHRSVHAHHLTARRVPHRCPQRAAYPASRTSHCCAAPQRKCHHWPTMPATVRKAAQICHASSPPAADVCLTPRPLLRLSICRLPRKHVRGSPWHHPWRAIA